MTKADYNMRPDTTYVIKGYEVYENIFTLPGNIINVFPLDCHNYKFMVVK